MLRWLLTLTVALFVLWDGQSPGRADDVRLRVMSFNIWQGGEAGGQPLEQTVEVIRRAQADIVGVQEAHGREVDGVRIDNGPFLAEQLGWHYQPQTSRRGILSRFPIDSASAGQHGVVIDCGSGVALYFFNVHFAASPYQPYQLLSIPYGDFPFITRAEEAVDWANRARGDQVTGLLKELQQPITDGHTVVLTGDFNEPSALDWTKRAQRAGRCPIPVSYPTTQRVMHVGLRDTFRVTHPDEVRDPGFTWTPTTSSDDPKDHHDRIDFVFATGVRARIESCQVVGEHKATADIVVRPWPSDHRAVVTTLLISSP